MKVLQINSVYKYGSTGKIAAQIAKIITANGDKSYIAYGRKFVEKSPDIVYLSNRFFGFLDLLQTRLFSNHGFGPRYGAKKLIKFIDSIEPDIIHLHNIHGYYLNAQVLFEYLARKKLRIVWTLHDCWPFTGRCAYFDAVKCYKWIDGCGKCPTKENYPAYWLIDNSKKYWEKKKKIFSMPSSMTIVTPSIWLETQVKKSFLREYDTKIINNGIDLKVFFPRGDKWKENNKIRKPIVLACTSIWEKRKGLADIPRMAALKPEYQFVVVGVNARQKQELPPEILAIERTSNVDELAEIYSSADVFINPTYDDNFPTANIEALACGTPVVTYATGGSPESLDENTGIVVEKGDIEGFARAITKAIEGKPEKYDSARCVARAAKYGMDDRFNEYYMLYRTMMEKEKANSAD